jgi:DNA-3-methyladenine glycosylase I
VGPLPLRRAGGGRRAGGSPPLRHVSVGQDGLARCPWGASSPEYITYHDGEWGRPVGDDNRIFEKLCLEGFQSGLSWLTILRKREAFRAAFSGFDPDAVAAFGPKDVDRLLGDAGIVRHRQKIEATIANARATVKLHQTGVSLAGILWRHEPARLRTRRSGSDVPSTTRESVELSAVLRGHGFRFVGPTTAYSAMQSLGVVNDHVRACHAWASCRAEREAFAPPGATVSL